MQHFDFDNTTATDLLTAFPHSPDDLKQSFLDYLEDKLSSGLEIVSFCQTDGGRWISVFKVVAK